MQPTGAILLFDGVCNLCNGFVQFILLRDPDGYFQFASLQSRTGKALLAQYDLQPDALDTVVLIENNRAYTHSEVAIQVAPHLKGPWGWVAWLRWIPKAWRDRFYNTIARHRYKWFGKKDACLLPQPEWKSRFIEDRE